MTLYAVTVHYLKTDETECTAVALVGAPSAGEAIAMAAEAVSELPHCLALIGGECEQADPDLIDALQADAAAGRATPHDIAMPRPAGSTLH